MVRFFEPYYASPTSKSQRWAIARADGAPFCVAALWERRMYDQGPAHWSFTLLTINADGHPIMGQMHQHDHEKRSIVIIEPDDYAGWLTAKTDAEINSYLRLFDPQSMVASAAPAPVARQTPP